MGSLFFFQKASSCCVPVPDAWMFGIRRFLSQGKSLSFAAFFTLRKFITDTIDFFYPPFRRFMPLQTFRYAACGGGNACLGLITYIIAWRYIFVQENFDFGFFAFKPHIAALFLSSAITFVIGFILNRYVVFTTSNLRGRIQLIRYFLSFAFNLVVNYVLLKVLVEVLHWNVLFSQVLTILLVIALSYVTQRHFTFRVKKDGHAEFTELH